MAWYSHIPVGHNTLSSTVKKICAAGGVGGYKTNHSLRVTSATCLFQNGADEQLIMELQATVVQRVSVYIKGCQVSNGKPFLTS